MTNSTVAQVCGASCAARMDSSSSARPATAALGISATTVKSHIGRIFVKLDLRDLNSAPRLLTDIADAFTQHRLPVGEAVGNAHNRQRSLSHPLGNSPGAR